MGQPSPPQSFWDLTLSLRKRKHGSHIYNPLRDIAALPTPDGGGPKSFLFSGAPTMHKHYYPFSS